MFIILEFDDLHWLEPENCLYEINYLINMFPNIKLSFFTVPFLRNVEICENKEFCNEIINHIENGNIRLGFHGLNHDTEEFKNLNYSTALTKLEFASMLFEEAGLKVTNVFRGPHWGINEATIKACADLNFTHIYNHVDYLKLDDKIRENSMKPIYYNWNLKDEFDIETHKDYPIVAHGHTHNVCNNGLPESLVRIESFIKKYNPSFLFIDEI